ncbi:MAG: peptide-methionine (S)-S-oxide reductase MsrA, partial [bacterium]|nr:peptide-methionine (S)-S-oxide reductase MsrA [bacterium]
MTTLSRTLGLLAGAALIAGTALTACGAADSGASPALSAEETAARLASGELAKATFAGGCFWCMEPPFDKLDGVLSTISGYTAGHQKNPTYSQVSAGGTGHTEALQIVFDPTKITFAALLDVFWRNIDPLAVNRQFCDGGS